MLTGDFTPGEQTETPRLVKPSVQIIPLISFEDTVGRVARKFAREAPQMIVSLLLVSKARNRSRKHARP